jgi:bis(5'-nucleosidyl)-tetraphosphatase
VSRFERSCGVVIFAEHSAEAREYLLLHYPTGHWDFAKGHVEHGEADLATALREAREETGLENLQIQEKFRHEFEYSYRHHQTPIRKHVTWFLGRADTKLVKISHEHQGYDWLPYSRALERVTYPNAKDLLRRAEEFLRSAQATNPPA